MTSDGASHVSVRDLRSLTSLRAFAALAVFAFHTSHDGVWATGHSFDAGFAGVSFFFVLSGFVLTWTWTPGSSRGRFYRRRFARVWPCHAFTLLVALLVPTVAVAHASLLDGLVNALLLQAWFPSSATVYSGNAVAWTLSCEALFYLLFPLLIARLQAWPAPRRRALVAAFSGSCALVLGSGIASGFAIHFPPLRFGEFLLGVALAVEVKNGWRLQAPVVLVAALVIGPAALLAPVSTSVVTPVVEITGAALLVVAATKDLAGTTSRVLGSRPLVYAGQVSFSFYLVHELLLLNLDVHGAAGACAALAVSVVAAVALHHLLEIPAQRYLSSARRSTQPA